MIAKSRSLSLALSEAVGSSMTMSRAFRTSARQMLISQFSAVDSPFTLALSGARDADALGDRGDVARDRPPVDKAEARGLGHAEHDVLQHGHAGNEGQLLVDEAHAKRGRLMRRLDRDRPPVDLDHARHRDGPARRGS